MATRLAVRQSRGIKSWVVAVLLTGTNVELAHAQQAAPQVTLKLHHFLPATSGPHKGWLVPWAERMEKASGGKLKIEVFPSMQLGGKAPQLYEQVKDGIVDVAWAVAGSTPGRFPRLEVFELPWVSGRTSEQTSAAMWEFYERYSKDEVKDVKVLALVTAGRGIIMTKEKAVKLPGDASGLKLRVPSRVVNDIFQTVGASPQGIPPPAVPEALSKGVIDGALFPFDAAPALKMDELTNRASDFGGTSAIYSAVMFMLMNQAKYDSLPADLKAVIDAEAGAVLSRDSGKRFDGFNQVGRDAMLKRNTPIHVIEGAELEAWTKATGPIVGQWMAERDKAGDKGADLVKAARELVDKYSK